MSRPKLNHCKCVSHTLKYTLIQHLWNMNSYTNHFADSAMAPRSVGTISDRIKTKLITRSRSLTQAVIMMKPRQRLGRNTKEYYFPCFFTLKLVNNTEEQKCGATLLCRKPSEPARMSSLFLADRSTGLTGSFHRGVVSYSNHGLIANHKKQL